MNVIPVDELMERILPPDRPRAFVAAFHVCGEAQKKENCISDATQGKLCDGACCWRDHHRRQMKSAIFNLAGCQRVIVSFCFIQRLHATSRAAN